MECGKCGATVEGLGCKPCKAAYMRAWTAARRQVFVSPETPKRCPRCERDLVAADFVPSARNIPGAACRGCMVAQNKRWAVEHPEKKAAQRKRWLAGAMQRDPEGMRKKAAAKTAAARKRHPGVSAARTKAWYAANPDKVKALAKARYAKNPEAMKQARDLRRARIKGGTVDGPVDRLAIIARDGGRCHLCGSYPTGLDLTLDHVVPLARGGAHAEENLRVACRSCNSRKAAS